MFIAVLTVTGGAADAKADDERSCGDPGTA